MRYCIFILTIFWAIQAFSQNTLKGTVTDNNNNPLQYATVVLLHPSDSTMAYYAISNTKGNFELNSVKQATYILQISYLGYKSFSKNIQIPYENGNNLGNIILKTADVNLSEVNVKGEVSPIVINKDTVEYNAGAFKVRADASTEELLKKLPGVEVDRAGNIKALGENVNKVMVDGKEFFSNDPKVATKNLPAKAIKKVQVYDKTSEESKFTGIKEGSQGKEMNLVLKDDHKNGYFGQLTAGAGTKERYEASAKVFNFSPKYQYAGIGMLNNINQYGFSINDYINFNGGIGSFMNGGNVRINIDSDIPIDAGQAITGKVTSGAVGANFSYQANKNNRLNISYLMNGSDKTQTDSTFTRNFSTNTNFDQYSNETYSKKSLAHRVNFSWRNRVDTVGQFFANGSIGFNNGNNRSAESIESYQSGLPINILAGSSSGDNNKINGNVDLSYIWKIDKSKTMLKTNASASGNTSFDHSKNNNTTHYFETQKEIVNHLFDNNDYKSGVLTLGSTLTQRLASTLYLEPGFTYTHNYDELKRRTGIAETEEIPDYALSPDMSYVRNTFSPTISLKNNGEKDVIKLSLTAELAQMNTSLTDADDYHSTYAYWLPAFSWEREYAKSRRFAVSYNTSVNTPAISQLLPVVNKTNPLVTSSGNRYLKPEYDHNISANWMIYDQFSFTSFFVYSNIRYTQNKIGWKRDIESNLSQKLSLINTDNQWNGMTNLNFSTPIRKLGLKTNIGLSQNWNIGRSIINNIDNKNTSLSHKLSLVLENRNKEKWDVSVGTSINYTTSRYDLQQSLNNNYFDLNYYADLNFTPNDTWDFQGSADIKDYGAQSFEKAVTIPILTLAANFHFLKSKKGVLTLSVSDLLNKNKGIARISELNYLKETYSDLIGRYAILTFKYQIGNNDNKGGFSIVNKKR
jgi:hypothetical protein